MIRLRLRLLLSAALAVSGAVLAGCEHHDAAMQGNADRVVINYAGDIADTLPIARRYCAQYERIPVLHETKPDTAVYACVRVNATP